MNKFIEFNVVKFINESKTWCAERKRLQAKLEGITEIKGIDNSPIRSGRLHDSVADVASEREQIEAQIARIETYQKIWQHVERCLNDSEKEILEVFFMGGRIDKKIQAFSRKHAMCRSDVYAFRRETLEKIRDAVYEKINVEIKTWLI